MNVVVCATTALAQEMNNRSKRAILLVAIFGFIFFAAPFIFSRGRSAAEHAGETPRAPGDTSYKQSQSAISHACCLLLARSMCCSRAGRHSIPMCFF